jgi:hypothetical protein
LSEEYLEGCSRFYSVELCQQAELTRTEMLHLLPSQQYNFTETGYQILSLPLLIRKEIKTYFYHSLHESQVEDWTQGGSLSSGHSAAVNSLLLSPPSSALDRFLTNHWTVPTRLLPLSDSFVSHVIVNQIQSHLEQWIQSPLSLVHQPTWRIYSKGAVIASHVTRPPHVVTMMIQIDYDEDEEEIDEESRQMRWPLQIVDHDGFEHSLVIARGEMMIYEVISHTAY